VYIRKEKKNMAKFEIDGYFKDDKTEFYGYLVSEHDDVYNDEDESIFFYGLSEDEIKEAMSENTTHDFVITAYRKL
jgi:hypothetical protein